MKFRFALALSCVCLSCSGDLRTRVSRDAEIPTTIMVGAAGSTGEVVAVERDAGATLAAGRGGEDAGGRAPDTASASSIDARVVRDATTDVTNPALRPAIVAVGYGGFRSVSFDDGKTWKNRAVVDPQGGDDSNLIRAVNFVEGLWVAVGWKLFLSDDGLKWTEISEEDVPGGWYDCVTSDNGRLIAKTTRSDYGGQDGDAIYSDDRGKTWAQATFATHCYPIPKPFVVDGIQLRGQDGIERSTDGQTWTNVLQDCCAVETFAKGLAVEAQP